MGLPLPIPTIIYWIRLEILRTPRPATGVSRPLRARSVPRVSPRMSPRVSPKTGGCPRECPTGVSGSLRAPRSGVSKKCPESVPGVWNRCPGHSGDALGTLFGHSGARGAKGTRKHPVGHSLRHGDALGDTSGPKGPRDSSSRPGGSQRKSLRYKRYSISRPHPSRDVIFFGQILAEKRQKLFLCMTSGSL